MDLRKILKKYSFPDTELADSSGILAIGGDLSVERLLSAYMQGIFPWFNEDSPIYWWSPDPRMVLFPDKLKVSKSLWQVIRSEKFTVTINQAFEEVISNCKSASRPEQDGTWITNEMQEAYINLHKAGYALSVETWLDGNLAGGLYGVKINKVFCGESMFFRSPNASKVALYYLVQHLKEWNFKLIDAQVYTDHLKSMGAELIPRKQYLEILRDGIETLL